MRSTIEKYGHHIRAFNGLKLVIAAILILTAELLPLSLFLSTLIQGFVSVKR